MEPHLLTAAIFIKLFTGSSSLFYFSQLPSPLLWDHFTKSAICGQPSSISITAFGETQAKLPSRWSPSSILAPGSLVSAEQLK